MQQFFRVKDQYPDAILFFRLGDFYEMFFEDAVVASALLDITLTSRSKTAEGEKIPMAGVPHHAAAGYVARLLEKGQKVAICEQMADPSKVKGVVPREVVRVVTPGLCLEPDALDARAHNYLATVVGAGPEGPFGLAAFELSTAELRACELADATSLLAELVRLDAREVLVAEALGTFVDDLRRALPHAVVSPLVDDENADAGGAGAHGDANADGATDVLALVLGVEEAARAAREVSALGRDAARAALRYARASQPGAEVRVSRIGVYDPSSQLVLDEAAVRNLEIVRTLSGDRKGSLLHMLDQTKTPMGARAMRHRLIAPLTDVARIRRRQDVVEALLLDMDLRAALREALARVGDLERLATRAELAVATPRDLGGIRNGVRASLELAGLLMARSDAIDEVLRDAVPEDVCADLLARLEETLADEPPAVHTQGGVFRRGVDPALDELVALSSSGKDVILELERREREKTGISNLRVKFTKVFGYYIEITKSNLGAVPAHYRRKQTVSGGERYSTEELDELQAKVLNADERARALEAELYLELRDTVAAAAHRLRALSARISDIDVHASLAEVAQRHGYVRPSLDDTTSLELIDARHPIVEQLAASGEFVPNDVALDADDARMMIITGPNMAGKSTAMRQVALAVIMAQAGGFVAASRARIGMVDRIYTRVGASDNLAAGQSTFMVEMREAAAILRGATRRSLVILDEIGRGTSTYDGLAIAWAVAEHLHDMIGCRAMFATHYHELCDLAATRDGVVNFNVAAREYDGEIVFLHKLVSGSANRSYGVAVAKLAGVPEIVLARAKSILGDLEAGAPLPSGAPSRMRGIDRAGRAQLDLFGGTAAADPHAPRERSEVEATLGALDVDTMRPVDALVALARLKDLLSRKA